VLRDAPDTRAGIEGAVRHHLRWVTANADRARYLLAERRASREQNRRFFARVNQWLAPRLHSGELRDVTPSVMHALWIGPSQELARHWLQGTVRRSPLADADVLASAAWNALRKESKR
jgi:hypothetical protein